MIPPFQVAPYSAAIAKAPTPARTPMAGAAVAITAPPVEALEVADAALDVAVDTAFPPIEVATYPRPSAEGALVDLCIRR